MACHAPAPAARPTILVVDDDPGIQDVLRLILQDEYDVVAVASAPTALRMLATRRVDLVMLDLVMPRMDGLEALQRMASLPVRPKVIVVSALNYAASAVAALQRGALDYITKPFDEDHVLAAVRAAIGPRAGRVVLVADSLGARAAVTVALALSSDLPVLPLTRTQRARLRPAPADVLVELPDRLETPALAAILDRARPRRPIGETALDVVREVAGRFPALAVEGIARDLGVSRPRLSEAFRGAFGIPPKRYLTRVRLEAARWLLLETREGLEVIAERVGLWDSAHLSRIFVDHTGVPPGAFRHAWGAAETNVRA
jgi:YesN/AraC family two-component response regulator